MIFMLLGIAVLACLSLAEPTTKYNMVTAVKVLSDSLVTLHTQQGNLNMAEAIRKYSDGFVEASQPKTTTSRLSQITRTLTSWGETLTGLIIEGSGVIQFANAILGEYGGDFVIDASSTILTGSLAAASITTNTGADLDSLNSSVTALNSNMAQMRREASQTATPPTDFDDEDFEHGGDSTSYYALGDNSVYNIGSWTYEGDVRYIGSDSADFQHPSTPDGSFLVGLHKGGDSSMSKEVAGFIIGRSYLLNYISKHRGGYPVESVEVYMDGLVIDPLREVSSEWEERNIIFEATNEAMVLKFYRLAGDIGTVFLDAIAIRATDTYVRFDTAVFDTHGSMANTTADQMDIQTTGYYRCQCAVNFESDFDGSLSIGITGASSFQKSMYSNLVDHTFYIENGQSVKCYISNPSNATSTWATMDATSNFAFSSSMTCSLVGL